MATKLTKPVRRETTRLTDRKGRLVIVTLGADEVLTFRSKGLRRSYSIYLGHCLALAQSHTVEHEYRDALEEYVRLKKAGRQFLRRPRRPTLPFNFSTLQAK